jgi:hypothetical protein
LALSLPLDEAEAEAESLLRLPVPSRRRTWFKDVPSIVSHSFAWRSMDEALSWFDSTLPGLRDDSATSISPLPVRLCVGRCRWRSDGGGAPGSASRLSAVACIPPVDAYLNGLAFCADVLVDVRRLSRSSSSRSSRVCLVRNPSPRPEPLADGAPSSHRTEPPRPELLHSPEGSWMHLSSGDPEAVAGADAHAPMVERRPPAKGRFYW